MKRAILLLSGTLCLLPLAASAADAPLRTEPFPDVPRDHWAFDAVEQLRQRGIIRGYPQQTFQTAVEPAAKPSAKPAPKPSRKRRSARRR